MWMVTRLTTANSLIFASKSATVPFGKIAT